MKPTKTDKNKSELSQKQLKALPFLVSARSDSEACEQAGINRDSYYSWLKEPTFKAELTRLRNLVVEDAVETLKANTTKATETLVRLLDEPNPALQRNVANDILNHVLKFKELLELEARLSLLENKTESLR